MFMKFIAVLMLLISMKAIAFDLQKEFTGFVDIESKELYVQYVPPQAGRPTVVLLNGLTYSTFQWEQMTIALQKRGIGVVRYDMYGMGQTLLKYGYVTQAIPYTDQVDDLNALLTKLAINAPYNIVGLSYGGAIAASYAVKYPKNVKNAILMAPYTAALESQDTWIKKQIASTRAQFPFNPATNDELYDYFLKEICYTTYPSVEPVVLENPLKLEAVFRMTQGIRKLRLLDDVLRFPKHTISLVTAEKDQYIPKDIHEQFWAAVPAAAKVARVIVKNSEHKIPEAQPVEAAKVVDSIVSAKK